MHIPILFEDTDLVVINKPAGLVVNRAESVKTETLQDWIETLYPEIFTQLQGADETNQIFLNRSGMVHRLDKDTSGVMVWAKKPQVMFDLMGQFKERNTQKVYQALVYDALSPQEGQIRLPLGRTTRDRKQFGVVIDGKMTETAYQVQAYYRKQPQQIYTLVNLFPRTGRTHQLRVVLKHLKHPIVGDQVYVGRKRFRKDVNWCQRQFLHALSLSFIHPLTRETVIYEAPLAHDLKTALTKLQQAEI